MNVLFKRKSVLLIIVIVLALAAYGLYRHFAAKTEGPGMGGMPPTVVEIAKAKTQHWQDSIAATGSLRAQQGIVLRNEVVGRVTKISFHSGQTVTAGQTLVDLNPAILKAQLAYDTAQVTLNKNEFDRINQLYKKKYRSKQDLDKAQANLSSAHANEDKTKAQLNQLIIKAPFSGKIGLRKISLGDYLAAGTAIANLQKLDPMYVDFSLPQVYLKQLKIDEQIKIHSRSYPKQQFHGKVLAFDSLINPDTRSEAVTKFLLSVKKLPAHLRWQIKSANRLKLFFCLCGQTQARQITARGQNLKYKLIS